jgi:hypothetical protein
MKPKIPAIRIACDECAINIGQVIEDGEIVDEGTPHYVHIDEWVEIMPVLTVKEVMHLSALQQGLDATGGNLGDNLGALCKELSRRITDWNWTDLMGEPLAKPHDDPSVLESLSSDELLWLVNATGSQESADDRKKDSEQSVATS